MQGLFDLRIRCRIRCVVFARQVVQKQHGIGLANLVPSAGNANALNLVHIGVFAQTSRVHHMQRHALNLDGLLHHIARGAGNRRDDGQLCARQGVEQRAFARVGLARNHHTDAFTQQRALFGLRHHARQILLESCELALGIGLLQKVNVFFGKVQRGFDQHAQMNECITQLMNFVRERTCQ